MSQDIISDTLNVMMNAKRAGKKFVVVNRHSKILIKTLKIAFELGYISNLNKDGKELKIEFGNFMFCKAIKPRFNVSVNEIEKYMKRYLPSKDLGVIIISTNKGLMTHHEAIEKNIGGTLIAYFY